MVTLFQLTIASGTLIALLIIWNVVLELRLHRLTKGTNGKNIEQHLSSIVNDYQDLNKFKREIKSSIATLDTRLGTSIRGIGLVRFNPFTGSGSSKPSFAIAFISEQGDGIILSTLSAHNSLSIFSKDIISFNCEKQLSEEEAKALEKAKDSLHSTV